MVELYRVHRVYRVYPETNESSGRCEILTVSTINIAVIWQIRIYQRFVGNCCLHVQGTFGIYLTHYAASHHR
jgi:hypothetical protein